MTIFMPFARIFARCNRHPVARLFFVNRVGRQFLSSKKALRLQPMPPLRSGRAAAELERLPLQGVASLNSIVAFFEVLADGAGGG